MTKSRTSTMPLASRPFVAMPRKTSTTWAPRCALIASNSWPTGSPGRTHGLSPARYSSARMVRHFTRLGSLRYSAGLAFGAGLPPIRFHDLRHGAATYALAAGLDVTAWTGTVRSGSA